VFVFNVLDIHVVLRYFAFFPATKNQIEGIEFVVITILVLQNGLLPER
jgi:hypothetical protein